MKTLEKTDIIDNRYRILKRLGQGRSGMVFAVEDTRQNKEVALKIFSGQDGERPDPEFHALMTLSHPNIVKVHTLADTYFTMELIEGDALAPGDLDDQNRVVTVGLEIARALRAIHDRGWIHGDLKREHILIDSQKRVKLIDFGMTRVMSEHDQQLQGSLETMAPELLRGALPDARADIYALGVVLYHLATGRMPLEGSDPPSWVNAHLNVKATAANRFNPAVPHDFSELLSQMLEKDPATRPQSIDEVIEKLTTLLGHHRVKESRMEHGSQLLYSPQFTGRRDEQDKINRFIDQAKRGRARWIILTGEAGVGKSFFIKHILGSYRYTSAALLNIDSECGEGRPLELIAQLMQKLLTNLESAAPYLHEQAQHRFKPRLETLQSNNSQLLGFRMSRLRPDHLAQDLAELVRLLLQSQPLIIFALDHLESLDRPTCETLEIFSAITHHLPVVILSSFLDSPSTKNSDFRRVMMRLNRTRHVYEIPLRALSRDEVSHMVGSMIGKAAIHEDLSHSLFSISHGIPQATEQLVHCLAEQGLIYKKGGVWHAKSSDLTDLSLDSRLGKWVSEKLKGMDKDAMSLIKILALTERPTNVRLLHRVSQIKPARIHFLLTDLLHHKLISQQSGKERQVQLAHKALGKTVVGHLKDRERSKWHRKIAESLESLYEDHKQSVAGFLWRHQLLSQNAPAAIESLLIHARETARLTASGRAIDLYKRALNLIENQDDDPDFEHLAQVHSALGDLHLKIRQPDRAVLHFTRALEYENTLKRPIMQMQAHILLAEALITEGSFDAALEHLDQGSQIGHMLKDQEIEFKIKHLRGAIAKGRHQWDEALEILVQTHDLANELSLTLEMGQLKREIGEVQLQRNRFEEAREYLSSALQVLSEEEDNSALVATWLDMATLEMATNDLPEAEKALSTAQEMMGPAENHRRPDLTRQRSILCLRLQEFDNARRHLDRTRRLLSDWHRAGEIGPMLADFGQEYLRQIQNLETSGAKEAISYLQESMELFRRQGQEARAEELKSRCESLLADQVSQTPVGLRREREKLLTLMRVSKLLAAEEETDRVFETLMDHVIEMLGAERGFIMLQDEAGALHFKVARNIDHESVDNPGTKVSFSVARMVLETEKPLLIRDAQTDERFQDRISVRNLKLRSILCVPFRSRKRTIGVFYVDNRFISEKFNEDNLELLLSLASQAGITLENLQLRQDADRQAKELSEAHGRLKSLNRDLENKVISQSLELAEVRDEVERHKSLGGRSSYHRLLGSSEAMQTLYNTLDRLHHSEATVIIHGESGSGKELVAATVHETSPRKDGPFEPINCAAVPENLLESELFGHRKGAFTGAHKDRKGLFELSDQGTLFLDEVGDMPLEMQTKLLRVLETGTVRPVGGDESISVDVRVVAASNKDLKELVEQKLFREDLYYRLNVITLHLPALRDRKHDIPQLFENFLSLNPDGKRMRIDPDVMPLFFEYNWPGNIRELRNVADRALVFCQNDIIKADDVRSLVTPPKDQQTPLAFFDHLPSLSYKDARKEMQDIFDKLFIEKALRDHSGNVSAAARTVGIERQYFHKIMKKFDFKSSDFKS